MEFASTILGVNGAAPRYGRVPTSQFLQVQEHCVLIDCGEGTQMRLLEYALPYSRINNIFISHLHGDHILGLPGLLHSFALSDRAGPLNIYSPPGLEQLIRPFLGEEMPYLVHFQSINPKVSECIGYFDKMTVHSVPLRHRVPTCGFLFREKPFPPNINPEKIKEYSLSVDQIRSAKSGKEILLNDGRTIPNSALMLPPYRPRSYAFVSDTAYNEDIVPLIEGIDLLYHETTFLMHDKEKASKTMHSTACEAATIAKMSNVGTLITGHYSPRYENIVPFLDEAKQIFPRTVLGLEGKKYSVDRIRELV